MKYLVICECKESYLLRYFIRMTHKFETWRRCVLTVLILSVMADRVIGHTVQDGKNRRQGALEETTKYF